MESAIFILITYVTIICADFYPHLVRDNERIVYGDFVSNPSAGNHYVIDIRGEFRITRSLTFRRFKRSTETNTSLVNLVSLNDTHGLLVVHWAGEGSDVIIALARDAVLTQGYTSNLYMSHDYGITFKRQTLTLEDGSNATVFWYFVSPVYSSHYIFIDFLHKMIWTTSDSGKTLNRRSVSFAPLFINFHPTNWATLVAFESKGNSYDIHISLNFGVSWRLLHNGAKNFYWGSPQLRDSAEDVYIHTASPSYAIKYNYNTQRSIQLVSNVDSFQQTNEFLIAIKRVYSSQFFTYINELWVSTNGHDFRRALLPGPNFYKEMFVADATEHQVLLCASINHTNKVNLYTSDTRGLYYSLSLENLVYYNPNGINNNTWLKYFVTKQFVDMHKVEGLNGIYIATTLINSSAQLKPFADNNQVTMISFNKGGDWKYLPAPSTRTDFYCLFSPNCNLHLAQIYHSFLPNNPTQPILSSSAAPGLILASGNTGSSLNSSYEIFMSSNGGFSWKKVLEGAYRYVIGDHGGIIVAIQMNELTNHIVYSVDEGTTWSTHEFMSSKIRVYGLFTEPGEETGVFTVFGSNPDIHNWIILQINLTKVFERTCADSDYTTWTPTNDLKTDCLLGRKMIFEKRKAFSICYNGRNYDRALSVANCPCKIEDYECDYGFVRNMTTKLCQRVFSWMPLHSCFEGSTFNRSKGYRRVPMDTCEGGMMSEFEPVLTNCPVRASDEFLIFANMTSIFRYSFTTRKVLKILVKNVGNVKATAYNYARDCLFIADNQQDNIQMKCLRGLSDDLDQKILLTENMDRVESMFYNWVSKQLFWVDAGHKRVDSLNLRNKKRKIILKNLDEPRSITIHPQSGRMFWSDWSANNPRIFRSNVLGSDMQVIVNTTNVSPLKWPSGLSVDKRSSQIYFVDAGVNKLFHCDYDGDNCQSVKLPSTTHPFSTGNFKQNILWTDPMAGAIFSIDKGQGSVAVKLLEGYPNVVDVHAFSVDTQQATSACSGTPCRDATALCFELSNTSRQCKCADEFVEESLNGGDVLCSCPVGTTMKGTSCVTSESTLCPGGHFTCRNRRCVLLSNVCNGNDDCSDNSDEQNCTSTCTMNEFRCNNGRCIPIRWLCDGDNDCRDMSDEQSNVCNHTSVCSSEEFTCASGKCILKGLVCDGDDDCLEGSDESNCSHPTPSPPVQCSPSQFQCRSGSQCIREDYRCDVDRDCLDGSDEENCNSTQSCSLFRVPCRSRNQCIFLWQRCDGSINCRDGSDEDTCHLSIISTTTFSPWSSPSRCSSEEFQCRTTNHLQCIPVHEHCDGVANCIDQSDELFCTNCVPPLKFQCRSGTCITRNLLCNGVNNCVDNSDEMQCTTTTTLSPCPPASIRCTFNNHCIPESWLCDGENDCSDGADEIGCPNNTLTCGKKSFSCLFSKVCINESLVCDGRNDCPGGSDELNCRNNPDVVCSSDKFICKFGGCIDMTSVCDGIWDCVDASDEVGCSRSMILAISPILSLLSTTHEEVTFQIVKLNGTLPDNIYFTVRATVGTIDHLHQQTNNSIRISQSQLPINMTMSRLQSNTRYVLTVSFSIFNGSSSMPIALIFITPPREIPLPNPPLNLSILNVYENNTYFLLLTWTHPSDIDPGDIRLFRIEYEDISKDADIKFTSRKFVEVFGTSHRFSTGQLILGCTYRFQVFARTWQWSEGSNVKEIEFGAKCFDAGIEKESLVLPAFIINVEDSSSSYSSKVHLQWSIPGSLEVHIYRIKIMYLKLNDGWEKELEDGDVSEYRSYKSSAALTEECRKGLQCSALIDGLNPNSTYLIELIVEARDSSVHPMCKRRELFAITSGKKELPPVMNGFRSTGNKISLNVSSGRFLPKDSEAKMRVMYRTGTEQRLQSKFFLFRTNPSNSYNFNLGQFPSCEYFCFYSQLVWPIRSPVSQPHCLSTLNANDQLEAPKHLLASDWTLNLNRTLVSLTVSWNPPCTSQPMEYLVLVQLVDDERVSFSNGFSVSDTQGLSIISFTVNGLLRGSRYKISVKKDIPLARISIPIYFLAEPYPSPLNLTYEVMDRLEMLLILNWERPSGDLPLNYEYEVYHSSTHRLKGNDSEFIFFGRTKEVFLNIFNKLNPDDDNSFKVRLKCIDSGMKSNFSNAIDIFIPDSEVRPKKEAKWGTIIPVIVVTSVVGTCLIISLVVYVFRYNRSRRSFDRFVSSRFNSGSNRAIITQLGEEECDQPLINNFSDDDPLIET